VIDQCRTLIVVDAALIDQFSELIDPFAALIDQFPAPAAARVPCPASWQA
jgi:hypothetical protein